DQGASDAPWSNWRDRARAQRSLTPKAAHEFSTLELGMVGACMRNTIFILLIGVTMCLTMYEASAAIRFKRFPHCPEGLVSKKNCECHGGTSGRFHFCHAGENCDTTHGLCHK